MRPFLALLLVATPAFAFDPFEIQVYDGSASPPGVVGLELHLNYVPSGPRRAGAAQNTLPARQQLHATFEPSLGVTTFWELGAYVQFAVLPDGSARIAGAKLRSKFVVPETWHPHLRLGLNFEVSRVPRAFADEEWGGELRPIVAWEDDRMLLAVNPNLAFGLSGDDRRPSFEPGLMAKVKLGRVAAGVEYYASAGPAWDPDPARQQEHYLFAALDLLGIPRLELNLGAGVGLTAVSSALLVKAILGWTFE